MKKNDKMRVWVADAKRRLGYVQAITEAICADWVVDVFAEDIQSIPENIDLVMISDERTANWLGRLLPEIRSRRIPVLHIADGVCDWKNIFENPCYDRPDAPGLPLYQPILSDKISCIGKSQVRILDAFGNAGKTELVGMPRLDGRPPPIGHKRNSREEVRICVTTARTAFFNESQYRRVLRGFLDLQSALDGLKTRFKHINVNWRLPETLSKPLHIDSLQTDTGGQQLDEVLRTTDVFITTPSTTVLEGMLAGIPTAVIEYNSSPVFVSAAWEIRGRSDLDRVLLELLNPPPERLWYQGYLLQDHLECQTPAMPRLKQLIENMVMAGRKARECGGTIELPLRVLEDERRGRPLSPTDYSVQNCFPKLGVWRSEVEVQLQLAHAQRENAGLRELIRGHEHHIKWLSAVSIIERSLLRNLRKFWRILRKTE